MDTIIKRSCHSKESLTTLTYTHAEFVNDLKLGSFLFQQNEPYKIRWGHYRKQCYLRASVPSTVFASNEAFLVSFILFPFAAYYKPIWIFLCNFWVASCIFVVCLFHLFFTFFFIFPLFCNLFLRYVSSPFSVCHCFMCHFLAIFYIGIIIITFFVLLLMYFVCIVYCNELVQIVTLSHLLAEGRKEGKWRESSKKMSTRRIAMSEEFVEIKIYGTWK